MNKEQIQDARGYGVSEQEHQDLNKRFTYHSPKPDQPDRYQQLRDSAKGLAEMITRCCPNSREKSLAITKLEESVMWANASIARNE